MNVSLRRRLLLSFVTIGSISVIVGIVGWHSGRQLASALDEDIQCRGVAETLLRREIDHLNWVRKVGQFRWDPTVTNLAVEKDHTKCGFGKWYYGPERQDAERAIPALAPILARFEAPHRRLHASAAEIEAFLRAGAGSHELAVRLYVTNTAVQLGELQGLFAQVHPVVEDRLRAELLHARTTERRLGVTATLAVVVGFGAALTMGFVSARRISLPIRAVMENLRTTASHTSLAASQVLSASHSLADHVSQQAAALEQTSASLEQTTSMARQNVTHTRQATDLARTTRNSAEHGHQNMESMVAAMQTLKDSAGETAKIVRTIDEIAFQTNLLALNAAVEAARAGEAGMGFAVVADEVRSLAQRCALAARETSDKIETSLAQTTRGFDLSHQVAGVLQDIAQQVRQLDQLNSQVASASNEQCQGLQQINRAVTEIDQTTQGNAAGSEESASAAHELKAQSEELMQVVLALQSLVDGTPTTSGPTAGSAAETPRFLPPSNLPRKSAAPTHRRRGVAHPDPAPV